MRTQLHPHMQPPSSPSHKHTKRGVCTDCADVRLVGTNHDLVESLCNANMRVCCLVGATHTQPSCPHPCRTQLSKATLIVQPAVHTPAEML